MNLDHKIKLNKQHIINETKKIDQHSKVVMKEIKSVMNSINSNEFFSFVQNDMSDTNKILALKEKGVQESERKIKEIYNKQVKEQAKEKEGIEKVYSSIIKK